jgi:pimeloyl-ACP methyl ester carboxylesterase
MKTPLILLHGAIGASDQLVPFQKELGKNVHVLDFPGHGGKAMPDEPFSIRLFARSVVEHMDKKKIQVADFFGYSMGGYVALFLARHYPERVGRVVTLSTKFAWSEAIAENEIKLLDAEKIKEKVPKFADALEQRHKPVRWEEVLSKTAEMMKNLGSKPELQREDLLAINCPVLVAVGDHDTMVSIAETQEAYEALKDGQFAVLPGTPHPIAQMNPEKVLGLIHGFLGGGK